MGEKEKGRRKMGEKEKGRRKMINVRGKGLKKAEDFFLLFCFALFLLFTFWKPLKLFTKMEISTGKKATITPGKKSGKVTLPPSPLKIFLVTPAC